MPFATPPPPPPPPVSNQLILNIGKSGSDDGRSLLLESIRQGKNLRKTTTNDRSTPVISGAKKNSDTVSISGAASQLSSSSCSKQSNDSFSSPVNNLGGLFVNGIPKLKPTGLPIGQAYQQSRNECEVVKITPSFSEARNGTVNHIADSLKSKLELRSRGPPPQPPFSPQKSANATNLDTVGLHNNVGSSVSQNETGAATYDGKQLSGTISNSTASRPSLAPKPSTAGYKMSPLKTSENFNKHMVTRAQSMRVPKTSPTIEGSENFSQFLPNQSELYRIQNRGNLPSFHQSQDFLNKRINGTSSSGWNAGSVATLRHNNRVAPVRPPLTKPPPPPTKASLNPPLCPPPPLPPSSSTPPPPPHRTTSVSNTSSSSSSLFPPPPPSSTLSSSGKQISGFGSSGNGPPTPPVRNSSIRQATTVTNVKSGHDVISRCSSMFHKIEEFPPPPQYKNVLKIYNSRVQGALKDSEIFYQTIDI